MPNDRTSRNVGQLLRRAYALARRNSAEALLALGPLSPVQASVLAALRSSPLTQAELGRTIGMEPANTHGLVRRLAGAGWVNLRPDPSNRRLTLVSLTETGRDLSDRIDEIAARATDITLAPLDAEEREMLIELLRRVIQT